MIEPINEPTDGDIRGVLETVATFIELKVLSHPRYRSDMTEQEIAELALEIMQADADATAALESRLHTEVERVGRALHKDQSNG